ncbi:MAG: hypothetical protein Tsb006_5410 [Rickettsiaceae bacterium]
MMQKFITFFITLITLLTATNSFAVEVFEVDIYIKEHKFSPEIIEAPAGRKLRITVHNQDSTIEEFESFELKREKIILGNSKAVIILAPLKPGEYKFFGDFHQDTAQGKIIVRETTKEAEQDV